MAASSDPSTAPIVSPCVLLCQMSEAGQLCVGCGRTLAEIAAWSSATVEWRNAVMAALPDRLAAYRSRNASEGLTPPAPTQR